MNIHLNFLVCLSQFLYYRLNIKYKIFFNIILFILFVCRKWVSTMIFQSYSIVFVVKNKFFLNFLFFLKKFSLIQCSQMLDIIGIDSLRLKNRFLVYYYLLSIVFNMRYFLVVNLSIKDYIQTAGFLYPSAIWLERECWDMFGILIKGNPDLRRILTDYGFKGFPLRKDFPVSGYQELYYNERLKNIRYYKISLMQEFRYYYLDNPWNKNI